MSVRAGREFLAIPGPTTVPDEVLRAMHRPAWISSGLLALTDGLRDIARVFNTKGCALHLYRNGHGAWEATLINAVQGRQDLVLEMASPSAGRERRWASRSRC
jgi:alanine-glyoxylate transaminase/serine-glyoxylate transaminase/serine-pyruvate transaminase